MKRALLPAILLSLAACNAPTSPAMPPATTRGATKPARIDPSIAFFTTAPIPQITLSISPVAERDLRTDPRKNIECSFTETTATSLAATAATAPASAPATAPFAAPATTPAPTLYAKVKLHLKGSIGSFRSYDDRPGFTLKLSEKHERFHGLDKFHLNNSVQDLTFANEYLGSMIFRGAGYPAARVTHARVFANERDLGVYVLKESIDADFLKRHFPKDHAGNLYENVSARDLDTPLPKAAGDGPDDYSDLKALVAACREPDEKKRFALIAQRLDVDLFLTFTALEQMLGHWDGYNFNRNNFHLYFRPADGRAVFVPNGMDQLFRDPNTPVLSTPPSIVGSAVFSNPEWKTRYIERVRSLLPLFDADKLTATIDALHMRVRPVLVRISDDRVRQFDDRIAGLKSRLAIRAKFIASQLPPPPAMPATTTGHSP